MKTSLRSALSMVLGLGLVFTAGPSVAATSTAEVVVVDTLAHDGRCPDVAKVRAWWKAADDAYRKGDIPLALRNTHAAYQAFPRASTAARVGQVHEWSGDHRQAFEWYLTARNHWPRKKLERRIMRSLKRLGAKAGFGVVRVRTIKGSGPVDIDGVATAKGGAWFGLSAGEHTLSINTSTDSLASRVVAVRAGTIEIIAGRFDAPARTVSLPSEPIETATRASVALPVGLIISGATVAGVGGGLHAWGANLQDEALAKSKLPGGLAGPIDDGSDQRLAAGILYSVGGAAILTGLIIWATQDATDRVAPPAITLSPTAVPNGGGLTLGGHF